MPLGFSSTGDEVAAAFPGAVEGRYVIITGGNSGLGVETARVLAQHGAHVTITARSAANGQAAVQRITANSGAAGMKGTVTSAVLDLADLKQTREFAASYRASGKPLHILIANAGVMALKKGFTRDGVELQFGTNHLGHFLLTNELLPLLLANRGGRVVNLSSIAAWLFAGPSGILVDDINAAKSYNRWQRYGASKLANILHVKELQRRYGADGLTAVAVHPGVIRETNLFSHGAMSPTSIFALLGSVRSFGAAFSSEGKNIQQGIATTVFAAMAPVTTADTPAADVPMTVRPGGYYSDCAEEKVQVHEKVADTAFVEKLWTLSESLVSKALAQ